MADSKRSTQNTSIPVTFSTLLRQKKRLQQANTTELMKTVLSVSILVNNSIDQFMADHVPATSSRLVSHGQCFWFPEDIPAAEELSELSNPQDSDEAS